MKPAGRWRSRSADGPCSSCRRGFTLIEIIIVMLIIGIASGLVGIMISRGGGNRELKILTKDISSVLRYARNRAVSEKKIYSFVIDMNERAYRLYSEDIDYRNVKAVIERVVPEGVQLTLQGSDEETPRVEFLPRGNSTGGVIELRSEKDKMYFIKINRITGKIDLEESQ